MPRVQACVQVLQIRTSTGGSIALGPRACLHPFPLARLVFKRRFAEQLPAPALWLAYIFPHMSILSFALTEPPKHPIRTCICVGRCVAKINFAGQDTLTALDTSAKNMTSPTPNLRSSGLSTMPFPRSIQRQFWCTSSYYCCCCCCGCCTRFNALSSRVLPARAQRPFSNWAGFL
jgi:hypothetical protein